MESRLRQENFFIFAEGNYVTGVGDDAAAYSCFFAFDLSGDLKPGVHMCCASRRDWYPPFSWYASDFVEWLADALVRNCHYEFTGDL